MYKLAVLIPVYNNQSGFQKTLESIDIPEGCTVEIVAVDDGSLTPLVKPSNLQTSHCKIKIIKLDKNSGIVSALNAGLDYIYKEDFDFIARLDAGDTCTNERMTVQLEFFKKNNSYGLIGSFANFLDVNGNLVFSQTPPVKHKSIINKMHLNSCFCHPSTMFSCSVAKNVGYYKQDCIYAEDYDFFWRFFGVCKVGNIPKVLINTEANPNGISRSKRKQQIAQRIRIQIKNFDLLNYNSPLGLIKSLVLFSMPATLPEILKKVINKVSIKSR